MGDMEDKIKLALALIRLVLNRGDIMAKKRRVSRKRRGGKTILPKFGYLAAALYWLARLILTLWDRAAR